MKKPQGAVSLTPEKQKAESLHRYWRYAKENIQNKKKENIQNSLKKLCWYMWIDCLIFIIGTYPGKNSVIFVSGDRCAS